MDDNENSIEFRVFEVIGRIQPQDNLTRETNIKSLNWDDLDLMELIIGIEEEFNIDVSDEDVKSFETAEQIMGFVEAKIK